MRRLGVDFGSFETVIAETRSPGNEAVAFVVCSSPNLAHLAEDGSRIMGDEVILRGLERSPSTARHLRHFVLSNSPVQVRCGQHAVSYPELAKDYLVSLIHRAAAAGTSDVDELVFSAPEGSPAFFREWLGTVAAGAGIRKYSVIDELAAAAAGYGISLKHGAILMVIDIGGDRTVISIASVKLSGNTMCFHVISRSIVDVGEDSIDQWIAADILARHPANGPVRNGSAITPSLLAAWRQAKKELYRSDTASMPVLNPQTGKASIVPFSWQDLEKTLRDHNCCFEIERGIAQALALAESRGCSCGTIDHVLMTGESSLIPALQATVFSKFGEKKVRCDIPAAAVAFGAALHPEGNDESQILKQDYALRYWDAGGARHEFRYIARRGTIYPTIQETARVLISAAYDGQTHLGLAIYAFGKRLKDRSLQGIELVADPGGTTRCIENHGEDSAVESAWINESAPTILTANPPGRKGDVRFELAFRIDSLGILRLDARDVLTGKMVLEGHACAALQ